MACLLTDSNHASHLYKRRLSLPLGKFIGLGMNCVSAGELLTIRVKQRDLPVVVQSPLVFLERCGFPKFHV